MTKIELHPNNCHPVKHCLTANLALGQTCVPGNHQTKQKFNDVQFSIIQDINAHSDFTRLTRVLNCSSAGKISPSCPIFEIDCTTRQPAVCQGRGNHNHQGCCNLSDCLYLYRHNPKYCVIKIDNFVLKGKRAFYISYFHQAV